MIVADASVVADLVLGGRSPAAEAIAQRFIDREYVVAPQLLDAEVAQVIRRYAIRGEIDAQCATAMVKRLGDLPIRRYGHPALVNRAFELRANVTVYDGLYLALCEAVGCPLLTGDAALSDVPGCRAEVEVVATSR